MKVLFFSFALLLPILASADFTSANPIPEKLCRVGIAGLEVYCLNSNRDICQASSNAEIKKIFISLCQQDDSNSYRPQKMRSLINEITSLRDYVNQRSLWDDHAQDTLNEAIYTVQEIRMHSLRLNPYSPNYTMQLLNETDDVVKKIAELNRYLSDRSEWNGSANNQFRLILKSLRKISRILK